MRRHLVCGIVPRRHLVHLHVGQLGIKPARQHRGHLPERCILDDDDRLIARVAAMAVHEILDVALVKARHRRQHLDRVIEVLAVLADDGDREGAPIFDQHLHVAVEHDAARRAQRDRALVVVVGQLDELGVLHDLEIPEAARQRGKRRRDDELQHVQPHRHLAAIFNRRSELSHSLILVASSFQFCWELGAGSWKLIQPPINVHAPAHRAAAIHDSRQRLTHLKQQHAGKRVGAGLAGNRAVGRTPVIRVQHGVQPQKYDRMPHGRREKNERPGYRSRHDELRTDNAGHKAHDRLGQPAHADDASRRSNPGANRNHRNACGRQRVLGQAGNRTGHESCHRTTCQRDVHNRDKHQIDRVRPGRDVARQRGLQREGNGDDDRDHRAFHETPPAAFACGGVVTTSPSSSRLKSTAGRTRMTLKMPAPRSTLSTLPIKNPFG